MLPHTASVLLLFPHARRAPNNNVPAEERPKCDDIDVVVFSTKTTSATTPTERSFALESRRCVVCSLAFRVVRAVCCCVCMRVNVTRAT